MGKKLKISDLDVDAINALPEFQSRHGGLDQEHVEDLAADIKAKAKLPPIRVVHVAGEGYFATDGHHTLAAHRLLKKKKIRAVVSEGSLLDAHRAAAAANTGPQHKAKKRTNADKERSVKILLDGYDQAMQKPSIRSVADEAVVSWDIVKRIMDEWNGAQEAAPRPSKKPSKTALEEAVGGLESNEWRGILIADTDWKLDDFVEEQFRTFRIETIGELAKRIGAGETLGLQKGDLRELLKMIDEVKGEPAKPKVVPLPKPPGAPKAFNWREEEAHYAYYAQFMDAIVEAHPAADKDQRMDRMRSLWNQFASARNEVKELCQK